MIKHNAMKNMLIKIKDLKAINYSRRDESFDVVVNFDINEEQSSVTKHFRMNQRPEILSHELVDYVKGYVKDNNKPSPADDFLEGVVIVRYNDVEEVEEKVAAFFKRFSDNIKGYKAKMYTEGFLTRYSTPDGFSMKIN